MTLLERIAAMPIGMWFIVGFFVLFLVFALVKKLFKVGCLVLIIIAGVILLGQLFV